ncbi:PREDICTED: uncharacterized protein LOC104820026 isoform X2 [Tarenaya hassleriana]|uniref:uncharacterized protein LOC104820026 isoform X2 n=1 Tax=Tarenaya hassleriana TaxID=28532 RepID=UPI00053C5088|nr:PREDICTED: uncharacterized protein LOC104820026 isoform X2 [Tarenaya hassleriana]
MNHHHHHQEHVASDHHLQNKTTSETAAHHQETRGRGRGKEVAAVVADDEHEHEHEHDERDHEEDGSSCAKKQEHNAKERLRRMKLHASYLALGTLLPDSPASKKWSAPVIIDRALTCIPELQNEVEHLTLRKRQILTAIETGKKKKLSDKGKSSEQGSDRAVPMVSVHDLGRDGEILVQICVKNDERNHQDRFGDLLHAIESQGMGILSSSSAALVSSDQCILSHHLHVKFQHGKGKKNVGFRCEAFRDRFRFYRVRIGVRV